MPVLLTPAVLLCLRLPAPVHPAIAVPGAVAEEVHSLKIVIPIFSQALPGQTLGFTQMQEFAGFSTYRPIQKPCQFR